MAVPMTTNAKKKDEKNTFNGTDANSLQNTENTRERYLNTQYSATANGYKYAPDKPQESEDEQPPTIEEKTYGFTPSKIYQDALRYTQSLLAKLNSGRTSYTDKINDIMSQIEGRSPFTYDFNTDTMFQQQLQAAMQSGKLAMQDTMGQASALTGGYGSTYSQAVGNQAYNQSVQGAYDNLPDYYGLALDAYNAEGNAMAQKLAMYQTADDTEYSRLANAYATNATATANLYDQEYNNYWQGVSAQQSAYNSLLENQQFYDKILAQYGVGFDEIGNPYSFNKSGSTSSSSSDFKYDTSIKTVQSSIDRAIENNASDENIEDLILSYVNGVPEEYREQAFSDAMAYFDTSASETYTWDSANGYYTGSRNGKKDMVEVKDSKTGITSLTNETPVLTLFNPNEKGKAKKNGAVYQDQYGNQYTWEQIVAMGLKDYVK